MAATTPTPPPISGSPTAQPITRHYSGNTDCAGPALAPDDGRHHMTTIWHGKLLYPSGYPGVANCPNCVIAARRVAGIPTPAPIITP